MTRRYPFADLAEAMRLSENQAVMHLGINGKQGQLYRREGMSEKVADRLAVKAGLHPFEVWPDMLEHQLLDHAAVEADRRRRYNARKARAERLRYQTDERRREQAKASARRYYAECKPYVLAVQAAYAEANRDRINAARRARYAREQGREVA